MQRRSRRGESAEGTGEGSDAVECVFWPFLRVGERGWCLLSTDCVQGCGQLSTSRSAPAGPGELSTSPRTLLEPGMSHVCKQALGPAAVAEAGGRALLWPSPPRVPRGRHRPGPRPTGSHWGRPGGRIDLSPCRRRWRGGVAGSRQKSRPSPFGSHPGPGLSAVPGHEGGLPRFPPSAWETQGGPGGQRGTQRAARTGWPVPGVASERKDRGPGRVSLCRVAGDSPGLSEPRFSRPPKGRRSCVPDSCRGSAGHVPGGDVLTGRHVVDR